MQNNRILYVNLRVAAKNKILYHKFWDNVKDWKQSALILAECWEWIGGVNDEGEGVMMIHAQGFFYQELAHVIAYALEYEWDAFKELQDQNRKLIRVCGNPLCVNISHMKGEDSGSK